MSYYVMRVDRVDDQKPTSTLKSPTIHLASWMVTSTVSPGIGTVKPVVVGEQAFPPEGPGGP